MGGVTAWLGRIGSGLSACAVAVSLLGFAANPAAAQAWWDSLQIGKPRRSQDGFLPVPSIATSLPSQRRSRRLSQMARPARRGLRPGVHQRRAVQCARRHQDRHHRPGQAAGHPDGRLRQARRLERPDRCSSTSSRFTTPAASVATMSAASTPSPRSRRCRPRGFRRCGSNRASPAARRASKSASSPPTPSSSSASSAPCSCRATGRRSPR